MEAELLWDMGCGEREVFFIRACIDPAARTPFLRGFRRNRISLSGPLPEFQELQGDLGPGPRAGARPAPAQSMIDVSSPLWAQSENKVKHDRIGDRRAGYIGSHMVLALVDAGQSVVVLDNLSTGFPWLVHRQGAFHQGRLRRRGSCCRDHPGARHRCHRAFRRLDRRAGFRHRSPGLLFQQYGEIARPDPDCDPQQGRPVHLLVDGGGLWRRQGKPDPGKPRLSIQSRPMARRSS